MPLHFRFFIAGIIFVLLGMLLGIWMGINENFTYAPVHAHLNLLGWATMFLYGLFYRGDERAAAGVLPRIQWWCAVLGLILLAPGIWSAQTQGPLTWLTIPGSILSLAAMVIFLIVVVRASGRSRAMA
jgi:hypothetical protein